jgi:hypothetical protein
MRKVQWLRFRPPDTHDGLAEQLTQYRGLRSIARCTSEQAGKSARIGSPVRVTRPRTIRVAT